MARTTTKKAPAKKAAAKKATTRKPAAKKPATKATAAKKSAPATAKAKKPDTAQIPNLVKQLDEMLPHLGQSPEENLLRANVQQVKSSVAKVFKRKDRK